MSDDAIIIKDIWGKVLSSLVIAGIVGGVSFAFAQNATNAEIKTTVKSIDQRTQDAGNARDARLDRIDGKIDTMNQGLNDVQRKQAEMNAKIDLLLEGRGR